MLRRRCVLPNWGIPGRYRPLQNLPCRVCSWRPMSPREDQRQGFAWPPRSVSAADDVEASRRAVAVAEGESRRPATVAARSAQPLSWWGSVERTFFGVTHGTWEQRTGDALWEPDAEGAYCGRCGQTVGMFESTAAGCAHCSGVIYPWNRVVRMGAYAGVLRECVLEVKFSAWRRLGGDLGREHAGVVLRALAAAGVGPGAAVLVPVPTSTWRRMSRGIDHTLTIARAVSEASGIPLAPILRREHRPPQTGRTLDQRRRNVAKTMYAASGAVLGPGAGVGALAGKTILLIDDVMTSGATMREACRAIVEWADRLPAASDLSDVRYQVWACPLAVTNAVEEDGRAGHLGA